MFLILWKEGLGNDGCVLEMPWHSKKVMLAFLCKRECAEQVAAVH